MFYFKKVLTIFSVLTLFASLLFSQNFKVFSENEGSLSQSPNPLIPTGEKVVTLKKGSKPATPPSNISSLDTQKTATEKNTFILKDNKSDEEIKQIFGKDNIQSIENNYIQRGIPPLTPNDTYFSNQWQHQTVQAPQAWDITTGSSSVVIANLDTGIDLTHPDLLNNLWMNPDESYNGVDDDQNGFVDDFRGADFYFGAPGYDDFSDSIQDTNGHGTGVSGILAAQGDNNLGVVGTCYSCKVMSLKVYSDPVGPYGYEYLDYYGIAYAIYYAVDKGAKVINLELQAEPYFQFMQDAINYAFENNVTVIGAAGNGATGYEYYGSSTPNYPSAYNNVVAVAAIENTGVKAGYSNYGDWVDISSPTEFPTTSLGGGYTSYFNGTSAATPVVSGVAGLIYSQNPNISSSLVVEKLKKSSTNVYITNSNYYNQLGAGMVNACKALDGCSGSNYLPTHYFTWNDTVGGTKTWTVLINPSSTNSLRVRINIPGKVDDYYVIPAGQSYTPLYDNIASGPIIVSTENGDPVIASQRSFTKFNSSVEYPGIKVSELDSKYYFTWYDTKDGNNAWTLIGNPTENPIKVRLKIGDQNNPLINQVLTIAGGQSVTPYYPSIVAGPVVVEGLNYSTEQPDTNTKFYTTQRIFTKFNASWEYPGIPASNLDSKYYFTWNDTSTGNNTWTLIGNPTENPIKVRLTIANQSNPGNNHVNDIYTIAPGQSITPTYANIVSGPITVEGLNYSTEQPDTNTKFYTTQRMFTKFNSSNEYAGIPNTSLTNKYYLTWNDTSSGNYTWTLIGNPTNNPIDVRVRLGNTNNPLINQTYTIQPGQSITPLYPSIVAGPIIVETINPSDKVFVTQRTFTKFLSSGEYAGIGG